MVLAPRLLILDDDDALRDSLVEVFDREGYRTFPADTARVALDFIAPVNGSSRFLKHQDLALANCFAQAEAFAFGQTAEQVRSDLQAKGAPLAEIERLVSHKVHAGNRPSSVILVPRLGAEQEVEIALPGGFNVGPRLMQAMRVVPGVAQVEEF